MDYDQQRAFLRQQRWRLFPAAAACLLLVAQAVRSAAPPWARALAVLLATGLLAAAYYLPNYLCLDVNPRRRLRWLGRARWALLVLVALPALASRAWLALALLLPAAALHGLLKGALPTVGPSNPLASAPRPVTLAFLYFGADLALLWFLRQAGVAGIVLVVAFLISSFFALLLLRLRSAPAHAGAALAVAAATWLLLPEPLAVAAAFLWTAGVAWLLARAERQNEANYQDLVESLRSFTHEPHDTIAEMLAESTRRLAQD